MDCIRADSELLIALDHLFNDVVGQHTEATCVVSDGILLDSAISVGNSAIDLLFRLDYLDTPNGYGTAPAKISVAIAQGKDECIVAKLSCGLTPPKGEFWFPSTMRPLRFPILDDGEWAYSKTRALGRPTIESWIKRRNLK